jgi:hypothetical protein
MRAPINTKKIRNGFVLMIGVLSLLPEPGIHWPDPGTGYKSIEISFSAFSEFRRPKVSGMEFFPFSQKK